jgi:hypothetical protein
MTVLNGIHCIIIGGCLSRKSFILYAFREFLGVLKNQFLFFVHLCVFAYFATWRETFALSKAAQRIKR